MDSNTTLGWIRTNDEFAELNQECISLQNDSEFYQSGFEISTPNGWQNITDGVNITCIDASMHRDETTTESSSTTSAFGKHLLSISLLIFIAMF